jgi:hypothetical protein
LFEIVNDELAVFQTSFAVAIDVIFVFLNEISMQRG